MHFHRASLAHQLPGWFHWVQSLMKNRRSISIISLKAGKAARLVWPQPQVLNMLGLHGDGWEVWLAGMVNTSVQTL